MGHRGGRGWGVVAGALLALGLTGLATTPALAAPAAAGAPAAGAVSGAVPGAAVAAGIPAAPAPTIPGFPDCKEAPTPELPDSGLAGFLDGTPDPVPAAGDPFAANPRTSVYDQYGYAGLRWTTYDLGCGGGIRDVGATIDTTAGNAFLSSAVWLTALANGLHNKVASPGTYMGPLDDVVATVTGRIQDAIWSPWGGVALAVVVGLLLYYSLHGRLSDVTKAAAWAILVLTLLAGLAQYPARVAGFFDEAVTESIGTVNASSAGLVALPPSSGPARAQGALLVDRVLYDAWVRGEFGARAGAAEKWGPDLYRASTFSRAEAAQAATSAEEATRLVEEKAELWKSTTEEIAEQDPVAYAAVQGKANARLGTGLLAALGALVTAAFRVVADVFIFAGLVMLRFLVMFFPAAAVIGVLAPMSSVIHRIANMGGASVVNVVAFSAGAALHTTAVSAVLATGEGAGMGVLALVMCLVLSLVAFLVLLPLLSFSAIMGGRSNGSHMLRSLARQIIGYRVTRQAVEDGNEEADERRRRAAEGEGLGGPGAGPGAARPGATAGGAPGRPGGGPGGAGGWYAGPSETFSRPAPDLDDDLHVVSVTIHRQHRGAGGSDDLHWARPRRLAGPAPDADAPVAATSVSAPRHTDGVDEVGSATERSGQATGGVAVATATDGWDAPEHTDRPVGAGGSEFVPHVGRRGEVVSGVIVEDLPEGLVPLDGVARHHDTHTEVRGDGIGLRLYDPATGRTELVIDDDTREGRA